MSLNEAYEAHKFNMLERNKVGIYSDRPIFILKIVLLITVSDLSAFSVALEFGLAVPRRVFVALV
ncbi:hypothetical protein SCA6_005110 [Theobroma cacao]